MSNFVTATTNIGDWRLKCKTVAEKWVTARKNALFTDVVFAVGPQNLPKTVHAHRNILAIGSPVFEAMFYGTLPEWKDPIIIPDVEPDAFEILLSYLYGENVTFHTTSAAFGASVAADKYLVPQLKSEAEKFIFQAGIHKDTAWQTLEKAIMFDMISVKMKYLNYIAGNAHFLLMSNSFLAVSADVVQAVLEMRELNIREIHLLQAIVRWGQAHTAVNIPLKSAIGNFLSLIRFKALTVDEFCSFTERYPSLIAHLDAFSILKHLHNPSTYQLPIWCSSEGNRLKPRSLKLNNKPTKKEHYNPFYDNDSTYPWN